MQTSKAGIMKTLTPQASSVDIVAEGTNAANEIRESSAVSTTASEPSRSREDLVRDAAYRRFEARGYAHGEHEDDWREAEKEVGPPEGN